MTVYCEDCDGVHSDTRKSPPWDWRCSRVPIHSGFKFVSRNYSPSPPFAKCSFVNDSGACTMFVPVRQLTTTES